MALHKRSCGGQDNGVPDAIATTIVIALFMGVFAAILWKYCWALSNRRKNPRLNELLPWWLWGAAMFFNVLSYIILTAYYVYLDCGQDLYKSAIDLSLASQWFDFLASVTMVATFLFPLGKGLHVYHGKGGKVSMYSLYFLFAVMTIIYIVLIALETWDYTGYYTDADSRRFLNYNALTVASGVVEFVIATWFTVLVWNLRKRGGLPPGSLSFWALAAAIVFELQVTFSAILDGVETYEVYQWQGTRAVVFLAIDTFLLAEACYVTINLGCHKSWRYAEQQQQSFGFRGPIRAGTSDDLEESRGLHSVPMASYDANAQYTRGAGRPSALNTEYAPVAELPDGSDPPQRTGWRRWLPELSSGEKYEIHQPLYPTASTIAPGGKCPTCGQYTPVTNGSGGNVY